MQGSLVFTNLGRPTKYTSKLFQIIPTYKTYKVIGLYSNESESTEHNYIGKLILMNWQDNCRKIKETSSASTDRFDLYLKNFSSNQQEIKTDRLRYSQIILLAGKILDEILSFDEIDKVILDVSSGRRIITPVISEAVHFLESIKQNIDEGDKEYQNLTKLKKVSFIYLTRPEHTVRAMKADKGGDVIREIPEERRETDDDFELHTLIVKQNPILTDKQAQTLSLWESYTPREIADKLKIARSTVTKIKTDKFEVFNLINKQMKMKITEYGDSIKQFYEILYSYDFSDKNL